MYYYRMKRLITWWFGIFCVLFRYKFIYMYLIQLSRKTQNQNGAKCNNVNYTKFCTCFFFYFTITIKKITTEYVRVRCTNDNCYRKSIAINVYVQCVQVRCYKMETNPRINFGIIETK